MAQNERPSGPAAEAARRERYKARIRALPGEQRYATRSGKGTTALRSMQEVADMLGVSRAAVHQLERTAITKIRVRLLEALREENPGLAAELEARLAQTA